MLYVTHSLDELLQLADSVVLLEAGTVRAAGPLRRNRGPRRPAAGAHARMPPRCSSCTVAAHEHGSAADPAGLRRRAVCWVALADLPVGTAVRARIPAREVILARTDVGPSPARSACTTCCPARSGRSPPTPPGRPRWSRSRSATASLLSRVTPDAVARLGLAPGAPVAALIKSMSIEILDGASPAGP